MLSPLSSIGWNGYKPTQVYGEWNWIPPLDGDIAKLHCRRSCGIGDVVATFGKYNLIMYLLFYFPGEGFSFCLVTGRVDFSVSALHPVHPRLSMWNGCWGQWPPSSHCFPPCGWSPRGLGKVGSKARSRRSARVHTPLGHRRWHCNCYSFAQCDNSGRMKKVIVLKGCILKYETEP